ncbi:hypothetical protein ACFLY2_02605 [Patescibacteria group bacterium]
MDTEDEDNAGFKKGNTNFKFKQIDTENSENILLVSDDDLIQIQEISFETK